MDDAVRTMLSDAPEMRATSILERLRPMGYRGGITVVRDLARELRPRGRPRLDRDIVERYRAGESPAELAADYSVSVELIDDAVRSELREAS